MDTPNIPTNTSESLVNQWFANITHKFEIVVYYQDLLFNTYEKKVILEYKVLPLNDGNKYLYEHKFITEDEKIIEKIPRLDLD